MTEKTYICNFCRAKKPIEEMRGLVWHGRNDLIQEYPYKVENHLCNCCWEAFENLFKKDP